MIRPKARLAALQVPTRKRTGFVLTPPRSPCPAPTTPHFLLSSGDAEDVRIEHASQKDES